VLVESLLSTLALDRRISRSTRCLKDSLFTSSVSSSLASFSGDGLLAAVVCVFADMVSGVCGAVAALAGCVGTFVFVWALFVDGVRLGVRVCCVWIFSSLRRAHTASSSSSSSLSSSVHTCTNHQFNTHDSTCLPVDLALLSLLFSTTAIGSSSSSCFFGLYGCLFAVPPCCCL
jgi:hypothetical protein